MKQILLSLFAISALFVSCSKETLTENNESGSSAVQVPSKGGIPVSFTVGAPDLGEEETDGEETKVSGSQSSSTKYSFQWKKGDKIAIFAFKLSSSATPLNIIDCGDFVAQNDGASATFTGTLPDTLKSLKWTSVYALANAGDSRTLAWRDKSNYYIKNVFLNPEQDGDGFKYSQYASKGWKLGYDSNNNPSFDTVTDLSLSDAVLKFDLSGIGSDNHVYKMVIRLEQSNPKTYNQYLTGDLTFQTSDPKVNSAGSDKTVTIYNGGAALPSTVYATTRQTVGGSQNYGYSSLVTYFYYKDSKNNDKMDVKTIDLATFGIKSGKPDTTFIKTSAGTVWPLPAIPALQDKFVINWVAGVSIPTVFAPSGSSYKAFPYANSSASSAITELRDGKGGKKITPEYGKFYYAPVRNYVFKMGTVETELEMGPATTDTTAYYHYPASYSYIRTGNCYIKIPAKEGYRLSRVKVGVDNTKTGTIKICSDNLGKSVITSVTGVIATNPVDESFDASKTVANTAYYLIAGDRFVTNFTFEYVPASAE